MRGRDHWGLQSGSCYTTTHLWNSVHNFYAICMESTPSNQTINQHSKYTVTWRQMVVGGQCSSAEWIFYCYWTDYQQGFGNLSGEFWLGLDKIHRLTSDTTQLHIDLQDFEGNSRYAQHTSFSVRDSESNYNLSVSGFSGNAGHSFGDLSGYQFRTRDRDNDTSSLAFCQGILAVLVHRVPNCLINP